MSGQQSDQAEPAEVRREARPRLRPSWRPAARAFVRDLWSWSSARRYWSIVAAGLLALGAWADAADALWAIGSWVWPFEGGSSGSSESSGPSPSATPDTTATVAEPEAPGGSAPVTAPPTTGAPVRDPIPLLGVPQAMTAEGQVVWVAMAGDDAVSRDAVSRIDAGTGEIVRSEPLDAPPIGVVHAGRNLWVVHDDRTVRLDPETLLPRRAADDVVEGDEVEGRHVAVAGHGRGKAWLVTVAGANARLYELDPGPDGVNVEHLVNVVGQPAGLVATEDALWVVMVDGQVHRIDPATGDGGRVADIGAPVGGVSRQGGYLWLSSPTEARVYRLPLGGDGPPVPVDLAAARTGSPAPAGAAVTEPGPVLAVGDNVWVVDRAQGTLARISGPGATVVAAFPSRGSQPVALAWTEGVLWTALAGDQTVAPTAMPNAG